MSKQFETILDRALWQALDKEPTTGTPLPAQRAAILAASQADQIKLLEEIYDVLKAYDKVGTGLPGEVMHVVEHKLAALKKEAK